MKLIYKNRILLFAFTLLATMLAGCEKGDSEKDYGFAKIYMPQATITGLDNSYPVPNNGTNPIGTSTKYNCFYADGILNINLGVVRAGSIADAKAFSVNVEISQDETDARITKLGTAVAAQLPSEVYQLPASVNVEAGKNTGSFYLSVNLRQLALSSASLKGNHVWKKLVLGVKITNPTNYELSDKNTSVVTIIDLNSNSWDTVDDIRTLFPRF